MEEERMDTERGARAVLVALNDGGLTERALSASLDELSRSRPRCPERAVC